MQILNILKSIFLFFFNAEKTQVKSFKASVKFSALLTALSGKVGGQYFRSSAKGSTLSNSPTQSSRKKGATFSGTKASAIKNVIYWFGRMDVSEPGFLNPDGSQTPMEKNLNSKQNVRTLSKAWNTLLQSDRESWSEVAQTLKSKNRFGEYYTPSNYQAYMSFNLNRLTVGLAPVARGICFLVSYIDDEAQETMICMVCNGQTLWCMYANDLSDKGSGGSEARFQTSANGNTAATMLVFSSPPMSPGRTKSRSMRLVAALRPVDGYNNFLLRPSFNVAFGKNLGNSNYNYKIISLSPGGAQTVVCSGTQYIPYAVVGEKIQYTEKTENFNWLTSGTLWDFGSVASGGGSSSKTFLPYGIELDNLASYTITFIDPTQFDFTITYGDPVDPLNLDDLLTDKFGNIPPIPLLISFTPSSPGVKTETVTITCGSESVTILLTGTGT